jgi:hypothetical protein
MTKKRFTINKKICATLLAISFGISPLCGAQGAKPSQTLPAAWVFVGTTADDGTDTYLRLPDMLIHNHYIDIWELVNYKTPQNADGKVFHSARMLVKYDCKKREYWVLEALVYAEPLGQGKRVSEEKVRFPQADSVVPDSVSELKYKTVCSKAGLL